MIRPADPLRALLLLQAAFLWLAVTASPLWADQPPRTYHLTIGQAKELALANNKKFQLGQLNLAEKQLGVSVAKRDYFPKVLGMAAYLHFDDPLGQIQTPGIILPTITVNVVNQDASFAQLMVVQPITKLIGVSALVDLARAEESIAAAQLDKGMRELLSGVTQAYSGLWAAQRIQAALSLQVQAIEPLQRAKPAAELRLALLELRKGLAEAEKQIAELTDLLNQLLGLPACTQLELAEPALPQISATCANHAADLALANSPQVREAEQNITKARAGLKAAKMDYLPDVSVFGAYVRQDMADYIQEDFSVLGVVGSYTFWDWGKRREVKRQRETQMAMAVQNVHATAEDVQHSARKAYLAYKQAEENLRIAKEMVEARQEAEKGAAALPEIMAAKSATAKAQLDLMQAELNYRLAHAKLAEVIGQP